MVQMAGGLKDGGGGLGVDSSESCAVVDFARCHREVSDVIA